MKKVFVDTAAWLALINVDDDFHLAAKQVKKDYNRKVISLSPRILFFWK